MDSAPRRRLLVQVERHRFLAVDVEDVFHVEARDEDARVRTRSRRELFSVESLGALEETLPSPPFFRIHREHVVNLDRVREVRRQADGVGWEVKLDPPVHSVLPVARNRVTELFRRLGRGT